MALSKQNKNKVKKVIKGLSKASKTHAGQAKTLKKAVGMSKGGSTVNKAGNYTKPTMRKNLFNRIKAGGKVVHLDNGLREKHRCWQNNTKPRVGATNNESPSKVPKKVDKTKVAYKEWQA